MMRLAVALFIGNLALASCVLPPEYRYAHVDRIRHQEQAAAGKPFQVTFRTLAGGCWSIDSVSAHTDKPNKLIIVSVQQKQPGSFLFIKPGCPTDVTPIESAIDVTVDTPGEYTIKGRATGDTSVIQVLPE